MWKPGFRIGRYRVLGALGRGQLHLRVPPPKLDEICRGAPWCTPQVLTLVETALAKDREARYPIALAMMGAVDEAFASLQHLPPE
jgi:hypothetical protein